MNIKVTFVVGALVPALALAQMSIFDAAYHLEAYAYSGPVNDIQSANVISTGAVQSHFHQIDAFAPNPPSMAHAWSNVSWNCTPTDLDAGLVACWDSQDFGAGNHAHMLSQLWLGITLSAVNVVSTSVVFDPPNSTLAIDMWNGSGWVQLVSPAQIVNYSGVWNPGDYRLRGQRLYNPTGNSTGCVPLGFHMHAEPIVPEPSIVAVLGAGLLMLGRKRIRA